MAAGKGVTVWQEKKGGPAKGASFSSSGTYICVNLWISSVCCLYIDRIVRLVCVYIFFVGLYLFLAMIELLIYMGWSVKKA